MSVESQRVVYGATLDIPYAIGSVSVPLNPASISASAGAASRDGGDAGLSATSASSSTPHRRGVSSGNISSVRRCTHHRYCYLRDGGALSHDAFLRWLAQQQQQQQQRKADEREEERAAICPGEGGDTLQRAAAGKETTSATTTTTATAASVSSLPWSPSLLYASLAWVVFLLPSSFPHPRRVLRHPPFIIEDDTWAEHMVEVQLHFLPHLNIPPVTVVHQALLERRPPPPSGVPSSAWATPPRTTTAAAAAATEGPPVAALRTIPTAVPTKTVEEVREVWVPQLLACNHGKPKQSPTATNVTVTAPAHCPGAGSAPAAASVASLTVVVAEKVDTLHLYHPTADVMRHVRAVLALSQLPVVAAMRDAYDAAYNDLPLTPSNAGTEGGVQRRSVAASSDAPAASNTSLTAPFAHSWSLPFEGIIAGYAAQRASTSVAVLQAVLANLKREREEMERACEQSMDQIAELACQTLPRHLQRVHGGCVKLLRKE
ncbi:YEATS family [Novymonas esmeraldas]|uniref:YEATS family n=1 Tax=Novymonas esmeraldas TaxID=1808958 RepID=A0AAW0EM20_9TRYP